MRNRFHPISSSTKERADYASKFIVANRKQSRIFWSCFECGDGDAVLDAIVLKSCKSSKLKSNLPKYISLDSIIDSHKRANLIDK